MAVPIPPRQNTTEFDQQDLAAIWYQLLNGISVTGTGGNSVGPFPVDFLGTGVSSGGNGNYSGILLPATPVDLDFGVGCLVKKVHLTVSGRASGSSNGIIQVTLKDQGGNAVLSQIVRTDSNNIYSQPTSVVFEFPYGTEPISNKLVIEAIDLEGTSNKIPYSVDVSLYII